MMGMHLGCRERLKNFSSPVGSFSPTVTKCWYSSQRKNVWRKCRSGCDSISGIAVDHGALEVELHHHAKRPGQTWVHGHGKVKRTDLAGLDQPVKGRQRGSESIVGIGLGVVALRRRTEGPLDGGIIVKEREKNGDTLDDRSAQLGLDSSPIVDRTISSRPGAAPAGRYRSGRNPASLRHSNWMIRVLEIAAHARGFPWSGTSGSQDQTQSRTGSGR